TTAFSSSCEYCGAPTDSSSDRTPALASTLIKSAPYLISQRILLRISSTPFAIPEACSNRRQGEKPFTSPCPPVADNGMGDTCIRGPATPPELIALRTATSTNSS